MGHSADSSLLFAFFLRRLRCDVELQGWKVWRGWMGGRMRRALAKPSGELEVVIVALLVNYTAGQTTKAQSSPLPN